MIKMLIKIIILVFVLIGLSSVYASCDEFLLNFTSRVEIVKLAGDIDNLNSLSSTEKNDLYKAKKLITSFLKKLNAGDDSSLDFLSDDFRVQFKDAGSLYDKYFDAESIIKYDITNFTISKNKKDIFTIYTEIITAMEGTYNIQPIDIRVQINKKQQIILNIRDGYKGSR